MTDISKIIHLYLGCEVSVLKKLDVGHHPPLVGRMCEVTSGSNHGDWIKVEFENCVDAMYYNFEKRYSNFHTFFLGHDQIKPILRKLSSMTESEAKELAHIYTGDTITYTRIHEGQIIFNYLVGDQVEENVFDIDIVNADCFTWLLSKGFWLFDERAFSEGLIIEAKV